MKLTPKNYESDDYNKYIKELHKDNMQKLFIDNFGGWSDEVSKNRFFDVVKNGFVQLFFLKDKFIGYVSFNTEKINPKSYLINDIHVVKEHQKHSYGSIILNYVITQAKKQQITQLKIIVFKNNSAINFYIKNGFKKISFIEKSKTHIMIKELN